MSTAIYNAVAVIHMREIFILSVAIEGKLEYLHAWIAGLLKKCLHSCYLDSQILSYYL